MTMTTTAGHQAMLIAEVYGRILDALPEGVEYHVECSSLRKTINGGSYGENSYYVAISVRGEPLGWIISCTDGRGVIVQFHPVYTKAAKKWLTTS
jgi:hypothetical protein